MKTVINMTNLREDTERYRDSQDLRHFYREFGCAGLELMHMDETSEYADHVGAGCVICPDMVIGIHACCISDWINLDREFLVEHYRRDLDYARSIGAEYVVFHVIQVSQAECLSHQPVYTDEEVIDAACELINELLDGQPYSFYFLMENMYWPGLNFLRPEMTQRLLDGVHYEKKGLMLDTGHFMSTNTDLRTQAEALDYLHDMLDRHETLLPMIKGVHLHQSLSGEYVQNYLQHPLEPDPDPERLSAQVYEHVFRVDRHLPFTVSGVKGLVDRISPLYLTYEYITRNREEHYRYLTAGSRVMCE